jgi:hypothetical protein
MTSALYITRPPKTISVTHELLALENLADLILYNVESRQISCNPLSQHQPASGQPFAEIKSDEKPHTTTLDELSKVKEELVKEETRLIHQWQLLPSSKVCFVLFLIGVGSPGTLVNIDTFIWPKIIFREHRSMLVKQGIRDNTFLPSIFRDLVRYRWSSAYTISRVFEDGDDTIKANQIYDTIPSDYIDIQETIWSLNFQRYTPFPHRTITRTTFLWFIDISISQYSCCRRRSSLDRISKA